MSRPAEYGRDPDAAYARELEARCAALVAERDEADKLRGIAVQMRQTAEARLRSQRDDETGLAKLQQSLSSRP